MRDEIGWKNIFKDFKQRCPNLSKTVIHWVPRNYLMITLYFDDGRLGVYDYDSKKMKFIEGTWMVDTEKGE